MTSGVKRSPCATFRMLKLSLSAQRRMLCQTPLYLGKTYGFYSDPKYSQIFVRPPTCEPRALFCQQGYSKRWSEVAPAVHSVCRHSATFSTTSQTSSDTTFANRRNSRSAGNRRVVPSRSVVKNQPEHVALSVRDGADAVAHLDAVVAAPARYGACVHGERDGVTALQWHDARA